MYKINRILDEDLEVNEQDSQVIHNVDLLLSQRPPKLSVSTIVLSDDEERSENAETKNDSKNSLNVTQNIDLDYVQTQAFHEGTSIAQDKSNRRSDRLRRLRLVREKEKLKHVESNQETITNKDNCAEKNSDQAKTKKWRLSLEPNDLNESIIRENIQVNELFTIEVGFKTSCENMTSCETALHKYDYWKRTGSKTEPFLKPVTGLRTGSIN
ncbi:unnamed protein product [Brachionus calyciflorus]|uniref:Uncharacterized protein n=1 Tax=Brachionus calyciflorus TaxID=104777 RepID=A0A814FE34_9BILA|nr:unnamed protein product [Brachionus calyciflorus]